MFESFSIIFLLAALLSYVNYRLLKLPATIGTMILALIFSITVILLKDVIPSFYNYFCDLVRSSDFSTLLLDVILSILLFAGAMHVNINSLKKQKWKVLLFSTIGVLISTAIVGSGVYFLTKLTGIEIDLIYCMIFGALISPTDPIAVIEILKKAGIKKSLELTIEGESMFNDGIGVVLFTSLVLIASGMGENINTEIGLLFLEEAVGGVVLGLILGWLASLLIRSIQENSQLSTILSIAFVIGGYAIAMKLGTSGPLAMVVSGLFLGHSISEPDFDQNSRRTMNEIWEILDESLNTILFVLIGLSIHLVQANPKQILIGFAIIGLVLISRFISISIPYQFFKNEEDHIKTSAILTWAGLRGGISIALALSIPSENYGDIILLFTFMIVLFSILVQGLTLGKIVVKLGLSSNNSDQEKEIT